MRLHAGLAMGLIFLAGCAGMNLSEADNGKAVEVSVGATFSVSLPTPAEPKISGAVVQLVGRKKDAGREVYEFQAMTQGEAEIRIGDYRFQVRAGSGLSSNPVKMNNR